MSSRLALFAILIASNLFAQEYRATLTGRVVDPSGLAVPNAAVLAVKADTNSRFPTVSGSDGFYTLPLLPPGVYNLTAEAKGFRKYVQEGITLGTNERVAQDVHLTVGDTSQSIEVTADAQLLESVTASTGQVMTTREVENLPVNGRSPMALAYLGFGVISNETRDQERPFENAGISDQAIGGAAAGANEMLLDGVPNIGTTGQSGLRVAYSPPIDSVADVKVESFNVDAAYGRTGGGTIQVTSKGGTNQFHGSLYEFNQNSFLNATPFFTNASGGTKTVGRQNNYGASIGGPVLLPKLYNGRNKLFFFFSWENWQDSSPNPVITTVPTAAERQGDFSALLALGSQYQIYDPATGKSSAGVISRTGFAGNIIPASRLSPVAQNYFKLIPAPNQTGGKDGTSNLFAGLSTLETYHSYNYRTDYNVSDRNKLTGTVHESLWQQDSNQILGIASGETAYRATWGASMDDVHTFTPTLVGDLRAGFARYRPYYVQYNIGYDATQLGFPSYINANATVPQIPQISFSDAYNGIGGGHQTNQPLNSYQLLGTLSKTLGTHTLKAGGEGRRYQFSQVNWTAAAGSYSFDTTWVKATSTGSGPQNGGSLAAFDLGLPTSGSYTFNAFSTQDSYYYAGFVNDDWHARPNLTVNLGLRWEHSSPSVERYNRQSNGFNQGAANSVTQPAEAAYALKPIAQLPVSAFLPTGGLTFSTSSNPNSYNTPTTSFAPRLGVSWTPGALHQKTVIRSGVGMFYYPYPVVTQPQPGFTYTNSLVATNDSYLTPAATLSNPFPNGLQLPPGASLGVNTSLGQSVSYYNQNLLNEYSLRWDLDVQHQFGKDMLLEVGYTGNHSVHLLTSESLGALPAQYLSTSPVRDTATINALGSTVANPFAGLLPGSTINGSTISVSNLLRPYPEFTGVTENYVNNGSSYFHQLAARFEKRFSGGLQFNVNYQHSRLMEKMAYLNNDPGAFNLEKRVASADRPNRLVFNETYDLPFGKGRRFLSKANWLEDGAFGGWSVATIYSFQSGTPLGWGNVIYLGGDLQWDPRNVNHALDTTRFVTASSAQLASNLRTFPSQFNNLRSDRTNNIDFAVGKSFTIYERVRLIYRAEGFNAFNRAQFSAPNLTPTASNFGVVTAQSNLPRAIQMSLRLVF
jgi:hypothetical protein